MKNTVLFSLLAAAVATSAFAQDSEMQQAQQIDEAIDQVALQAEDGLNKTSEATAEIVPTFANSWSGSFYISGSFNETLNHGAGDRAEKYAESSYLGIGARLSAAQGNWGQSIDIFGSYADTDETDPQRVLKAKYQLTRGFGQNLYGYASATANYNNLDLLEFDGFLNVGLGYRVLNTNNFTWRVQGGPGYRYSFDQFDVNTTGAGFGAASRMYWQITPTTYLTNDTDAIWSDSFFTVYNDAGVSFKVSDQLSTRIGYRVESTQEADTSFENIQKNMTVSAVLNF